MDDRQLESLKNALQALYERDYGLAYTYLYLVVEAEEGNRFWDRVLEASYNGVEV